MKKNKIDKRRRYNLKHPERKLKTKKLKNMFIFLIQNSFFIGAFLSMIYLTAKYISEPYK